MRRSSSSAHGSAGAATSAASGTGTSVDYHDEDVYSDTEFDADLQRELNHIHKEYTSLLERHSTLMGRGLPVVVRPRFPHADSGNEIDKDWRSLLVMVGLVVACLSGWHWLFRSVPTSHTSNPFMLRYRDFPDIRWRDFFTS